MEKEVNVNYTELPDRLNEELHSDVIGKISDSIMTLNLMSGGDERVFTDVMDGINNDGSNVHRLIQGVNILQPNDDDIRAMKNLISVNADQMINIPKSNEGNVTKKKPTNLLSMVSEAIKNTKENEENILKAEKLPVKPAMIALEITSQVASAGFNGYQIMRGTERLPLLTDLAAYATPGLMTGVSNYISLKEAGVKNKLLKGTSVLSGLGATGGYVFKNKALTISTNAVAALSNAILITDGLIGVEFKSKKKSKDDLDENILKTEIGLQLDDKRLRKRIIKIGTINTVSQGIKLGSNSLVSYIAKKQNEKLLNEEQEETNDIEDSIDNFQ